MSDSQRLGLQLFVLVHKILELVWAQGCVFSPDCGYGECVYAETAIAISMEQPVENESV